MKSLLSLVFLTATLVSSGMALGEGRQFYRCKLADGKTFADLQAWAAHWRVAADEAGLQAYRNTILVPVGNTDLPEGSYMWEAAAPSADEFAAVEKWFAESDEAGAFQERFSKIASCEMPTSWKVSR